MIKETINQQLPENNSENMENIILHASEMDEFKNAIYEAPDKKRAIIAVAYLLPIHFPEHFAQKSNEELKFRRETAKGIVDLFDK